MSCFAFFYKNANAKKPRECVASAPLLVGGWSHGVSVNVWNSEYYIQTKHTP